MSKISDTEAMSLCIKNGVTIYPVYNKHKRVIQKKEYKGNSWFIEVNNNGTKTIYNKAIGTGTTLSSKSKTRKKKNSTDVDTWHESIMKTWQHWAKLINEQT
jgi:hypothetical protein